MEPVLRFIERLVPRPIYRFFQPAYHYALSWAGAVAYRHPSRGLCVVAVTGTKGKSSTVELIRCLLAGAGYRAASLSTIQFCIGEECRPNRYKMTVPGRFAVQKFLREALDAGCTHAIVEMTSEGVRQSRHRNIDFNALVFTNLAPEHLESHGSFEAYRDAKLSLARAVADSPKRPRILVANADDPHGAAFLDFPVEVKASYSLRDAEPYHADDRSARFTWHGELFSVPLPGLFNLYNCLAALALGDALGLPRPAMKRALEHVAPVAGRAQRIECGQPFDVIVDYAHTVESLTALYETFSAGGKRRLIALIGATGGGRDARKRAARGALAQRYAARTFITNEDPYDEDPLAIMQALAAGFTNKTPQLILDRRAAIRAALKAAREGDVVLITGKGTDPYLMGPRGQKTPWSDAAVATEELKKLGYH